MDTDGDNEISELRDDVSDIRADFDIEAENEATPDDEEEGLWERDATDEGVDLIDREFNDVNVFNAVYDGVFRPVRVIIAVTVTAMEDDDIGDIDSVEVGL